MSSIEKQVKKLLLGATVGYALCSDTNKLIGHVLKYLGNRFSISQQSIQNRRYFGWEVIVSTSQKTVVVTQIRESGLNFGV